MSALPAILMVAGTTMTAISQIREAKQMSAAEQYNAQVARAQAESVAATAKFESEVLKKQSEVEQAKTLREKQKTLSSQRAAYAKSGVVLSEGSPLAVMADTATEYELDLATERYNLATGLEKLRYESQTEQALLQSEASYRESLAKEYTKAGYLKAGSTLLTGYGIASGYGGTKK